MATGLFSHGAGLRARFAGMKTRVGDRSAHLLAALGLTLLELAWMGAVAVLNHPDLPYLLPLIALVMAALAGMLLVLGGFGWATAQLIRLVVLWRAKEELHEGMTRAQIAGVLSAVVFLGVPEFAHAFVWWHENALRFIPGEEQLIERVAEFGRQNAQAIGGLAIMAGLWSWIFWGLFSNFRDWLRRTGLLMRTLLTNRDWRLPGALAVTITATLLLLKRNDTDLVADLLAAQVIAVAVWVMLPVIVPSLAWIAVAAACILPALAISERLGGNQLLYFAIMVGWGGWLLSVLWRRMWLPVYWLGVLGLLGWLAWP
jgi:hypothetical protein